MIELRKVCDYPIIDKLESDDLISILPYLNENEYTSGSILLKQGQVSDVFHIILSGILDVYVEKEVSVHIASLEKGQIVGEMSCLTGERVSATVKARNTVKTLSLPRDGLFELMDKSASFRKQMLIEMIKRIGKSNERVLDEFTRSSVVVKQLEQERQSRYGKLVGNSEFMRQLRERINVLAYKDNPVVLVGENGVGKHHIATEIHQRSARSQFPLLTVDGASLALEDWHMKMRAAKGGTIIVEQADLLPADILHRFIQSSGTTRLILTAKRLPIVHAETVHVIPLRERAEDIPELVEEYFRKTGNLTSEEMISEEAMKWLISFPYICENISELNQVLERAFLLSEGKTILKSHIRFGRTREPGTKPKIGLALGSGSVRGAAHVGVLKVLEKEGIPIDIVTGTSVGAFIGALYVGGQPVSAFEKVLPTVRWRQLVHLAMPPIALVDNNPMIRFVEKYIGPVHFEELPKPFAAVASDVITGEAYILNKGSVAEAICATTAIPGIMKPVRYQNRLLVDGAIAQPVPVTLAKSMGADIIIAVDVSIPPSTKKAPQNFITSILNTIELMNQKLVTEQLELADVVLHPQLEINKMTFKASAAYIQAGELVTYDAIASIKQKIDASISS